MRNFIFLLAFTAITASCSRPGHNDGGRGNKGDSPAMLLPAYDSDLYDQGKTEACWVYAVCACIENEAWRRGDSVKLSRQWLMSNLLKEQAMERYDMQKRDGKEPADGGRGTLSMRGVGPEAIRLIDRYGLVPWTCERSLIANSRVLQRRLTLLADNAVRSRLSREDFNDRMQPLLPAFTVSRHQRLAHGSTDGEEQSFYYLSMRYTPRQFAESVMYYQQWRWYASEETHPWGEKIALEVADNRRYHEYVNKPMPELLAMVKRSLRNGHAVYWEFGHERSRQKGGGGADSNHAMAITGMKGGRFVCLNSYGKKWGRNGYCLVTEKYFMEHTCNVGIIEEAEW